MSVLRLAVRDKRRRRLRLCLGCGGQRLRGRLRCEDCLSTMAAKQRQRRREKRMAGVCFNCDRLAIKGAYCVRHRLRAAQFHAETMDRQRVHRRQRGLCVRCGAAAGGRWFCAAHARQQAERRAA